MNKQPIHHSQRPGFTIVELLVVIAIIGVLAALITGAVFAAVVRARNATIKLQVGQLAMALERYKTEIGEYPPDLSNLTVDQKRLAIDSHLARKYRLRSPAVYQFDSATGQPTGGDGLTDEELALLNPTNALYFWLRGFSSDPQRPLTGLGDRDSFFDFAGRLNPPAVPAAINNFTEPNKPAIASFAPKADAQQRPYLYYRALPSYPIVEGTNPPQKKLPYHDALVWANEVNTNPGSVVNVPEVTMPLPYISAVLKQDDPNTPAVEAEPARVEPEKFQLICAGMDSEYGEGGLGTGADVGVYPTGLFRKPDRDNITSFNEGSTLEDAQ